MYRMLTLAFLVLMVVHSTWIDSVQADVLDVIHDLGCKVGLSHCDHEVVINNNAPQIYCDTESKVFLAPPKALTAVATWPLPSAHDEEDGSLTPRLVGTTSGSGSTFTEGTHIIYYKVTDSRGVENTCSITVVIKVARCSEPSPIPNGIKSCSKTSGLIVRGDTCSYSCKNGYTLTGGNSRLTCNKNGTFHSDPPICEPVQCPAPKNMTTGMYTCPSTKYKDDCYLKCATGYKPGRGNLYITCQADRTWTKSATCEAVQCPTPNAIAGGNYTCPRTKYEFKDTCDLKCATGYRPGTGSQHITCQADRTWTKSASCEAVQCPAPKNMTTGMYTCPSTKYKDDCYLKCATGYKPGRGNLYITCQADRTWTKSATCVAVQCPTPNTIAGGNYTCSSTKYEFKDTCDLKCATGYRPGIGNLDITCQADRTWTKSASCVAVQCAAPANITGGTYICPSTKYEFKDACYLKCASGSRPGNGNQHITCQANRTWTASALCIDEPVFRNCPLNLTFFSDRGVSHTNVTWPNVTAIYPSTNKTARVVLATSKSRGTFFDEGVHQVTYHAYDNLGRRSEKPCSFTVTVETIRCPHPNLHPGGKDLMLYNCSDYKYGTVCPVSCKSGYPLGGPDHIVCERDASFPPVAAWTWNKTSGLTPYCMERNCSNLTAPDNGAMVCDKWMHGSMCQMQCNANYSFPRSAPHDGMFVCGSANGQWMPTEDVPDCVAYSGFSTMRMPAYFYYNGSCPGNPAVQNQIKQNFIKALSSSIKFGIASCKDVKACQPDNVQVICGKVTRDLSGPGSKDSLTIKFDVVVAYDDSKGSGPSALGFNDQRLHTVAAKLQTVAQTNTLGLDKFGLKLDKASVEPQTATLDCPRGKMPDMSKGICVGCPKGSRLDSSTKSCVDCPVGSYQDQDSSVTCLTCPDGMSTAISGSKNMSDCKGICQPGFISPDGLEPCNPCPMGTFQGMPRNQHCTACPKGQITRSTAATANEDCTDFDLSLQANGVAIFKAQPQPLSQLTFAMWLYLYDTVTESFDIATWQDPLTMKTSFALVLKNSLELIAGRSSAGTDIGLQARQWTHVALQADSQSGLVNLYVNGKLAATQNMKLQGAFIPAGHSLTIRTSNNVPAVLSHVMVYDTVISASTIAHFAASCSTHDTNYIVDQTDLTDLSDGVNHVIPSVCGEFLQ
ncbi:sushi, von Willebrand factor type A, EGF and pentraxin domain-containing protein 1-like [Haliotis asinina]|uniref:sushi, von Willebrand factor type A, EGF and pentraxin domain-containing protein 1-like n=1 Tax=Haliotis asinina TaxID=109174 RepID=UPI00353251CC